LIVSVNLIDATGRCLPNVGSGLAKPLKTGGLVTMSRRSYPSDLTDAQWKELEPLLPPPKSGGRPRTADMREIVNAMLYLSRSGCSWRMLPHEFPPWPTAHHYYRQWRREGHWAKIHDTLREALRKQEGRETSPSAAILDSQSVKTTEKGVLRGAMTRARR